jgi:hypothetical protein
MLLKTCLRLAVFLCTLTAALLVTRFFLVPPRAVEVTVQTPAPPPVAVVAPVQFDYRVLVVAFERDGGRLDTRLTVTRATHTPTPASLWVWTYFFTPDSDQVWATPPVEVRAPFAQGDIATLGVGAPCPTCMPVDMNKDTNYYARVYVSTVPPPPGYERGAHIDLDIRTATPVVVSHMQRR